MTSRLQAIEPRGVTVQKATTEYTPAEHITRTWHLQVYGCCWLSSNIYSRKKYSQRSWFKLIYLSIFFHFSLRKFLNTCLVKLTPCKRAYALHNHAYHRKFINNVANKWQKERRAVLCRTCSLWALVFVSQKENIGLPLLSLCTARLHKTYELRNLYSTKLQTFLHTVAMKLVQYFGQETCGIRALHA